MLDLINKLQKIEMRKLAFQIELKAIESNYHENGTIVFEHTTKDYVHKGGKSHIQFDKNLMMKYIKEEIKALEIESRALIEQLT